MDVFVVPMEWLLFQVRLNVSVQSLNRLLFVMVMVNVLTCVHAQHMSVVWFGLLANQRVCF